ncbi:MAG: DegT/DnrJ/EryC1/StrS family aminotransferase [Paracoccaceae bacterium]|jgi:UDP-2-acetamido-2-deoxy-ribo-hexuluronate aminotransferase
MRVSVPFIDLKRFEPGFHEALLERFSAMTAGAQFIAGPEVARLEDRLSSYLDVKHAISCANGTDAIQLALRAIGVGEGDLVLVPNVTFWATFEAIVNVGGRPVTIDADLSDGGVCFTSFETALRAVKPKAAVLAHLYGWGSARLEELRHLCRRQGVALVEDGAQAFGTTYLGRSVFSEALISTTSFYPAKVLGAAGDGGAVFTNDPNLAERIRRLGNHGRTSHYGYGDVGWNSRLNALQAAFLNLALDHVDARILSRLESAAFYDARLPSLGIKQIRAPKEYRANGYCNVCLVEDAEKKSQLETLLKDNGIGFGNIYPSVMSAQPGAGRYLAGHFGGHQGEHLCASVLNLPIFPYMTPQELQSVVDVVGHEEEAPIHV